MKITKPIVLCIMLLFSVCTSASALTYGWDIFNTLSFSNDYQSDSLYLFITDGDVTFSSLNTAPAGWSVDVLEPTTLVVSGTMINAGDGNFTAQTSDRFNWFPWPPSYSAFNLEWAEVLGGEIQGAGTLYFDNSAGLAGTSDAFTSTVPIPAGYWLLGSGLICLVGIKRKMNP